MSSEKQVAQRLLTALDEGQSQKPDPQLSVGRAYRIVADIRALRTARGETPVGRKIGFTNSLIWQEYGIFEPIWGYMYDSTVSDADPESDPCIEISNFLEPRIEPEIAFGFGETPVSGMDDAEILSCIEWVAHGLEIVQSLYPDWKLGVADAIAGHGVHGSYLLGNKHRIDSQEPQTWMRQFEEFEIEIFCDGQTVDRGIGSNVLGGPLSAVRHLLSVLEKDEDNPPVGAGELVTTGTLTRATPVRPGQRWETRIRGIPVEGLFVRIEGS